MPSNGAMQHEETAALIPIPPAPAQQLTQAEFFQEPKRVLERAEKVAKALKKFLDRKKKKVEFNGERYPQAEDWQFVGAFFGHTARVKSTRELKDDDGYVIGYVAFAEVVNHLEQVVSAAEAACMRSEKNWGGTKPDFQLRSMAQTRACAKALRNVFAWVMIMAGLAPTPAEEMSENETAQPVVAPPRRKSETIPAKTETISTAQQKRLFAIARDAGKDHDQVRELIGRHGFEHSHEITRAAYDSICAELVQ